MDRIVWKFPDGSVQLSNVQTWPRIEGESDQQHLDRVAPLLKAKLAELDPAFLTATYAGNVPEIHHKTMDRTFRGAWTWTTPAPVIDTDMVKAAGIWRDRMRAARVPKMAALDVAYQRADEIGDVAEKARIAVKKQALRDVTSDAKIDAALTPEALKAVWPEVLA